MSRASQHARFFALLSACRTPDGTPLTLQVLAREALCAQSHSHLSQVIGGTRPGARTRRRVSKYLTEKFPQAAPELFKELGWTEETSRFVPKGTFHVEH